MGALHELAQRHSPAVAFVVIYICEAHPTDGWQVTMNIDDNVLAASPTTDRERLEVATACALALEIDLPVVIDPIDDRLADAYGAHPDRLYLIDTDGRVAYQGGPGPMGFQPSELDQAIGALLG